MSGPFGSAGSSDRAGSRGSEDATRASREPTPRGANRAPKPPRGAEDKGGADGGDMPGGGFDVRVTKIGSKPASAGAPAAHDPERFYEERLLKPMPFFANSELRDLASNIQNDIISRNPVNSVSAHDILLLAVPSGKARVLHGRCNCGCRV